jgi:ABC-type dipeptide/oligopeptide/nickel transport system permease component/ABC-type transport system substrate-binding protein
VSIRFCNDFVGVDNAQADGFPCNGWAVGEDESADRRMNQALKSIKNLLLFLAVAMGFAMCMWVLAWLVRPSLSDRPFSYTPQQVADAVKARDVRFDREHTPTLYRHIHVDPKGEAPMLADLVREGQLPPVQERMPRDPAVMEGVDGIGKYGGTWLRFANAPNDVIDTVPLRLAGANMMRWSPLGYPIEPHIAKSVEPSADMKEWTITLREGMRWSDGEPYTTDDVMFFWEHEANDRRVLPAMPQWLLVGGKAGRIERIDLYHFKIIYPEPYPLMREMLAQNKDMCDSPAHYLRRFHPDDSIADVKLRDELMKAYKMPSPRSLYLFLRQANNPEHPRLWPWVYRTYRPNSPQVFVRNPYYFVVDTAGNQLPYLDRLQMEIQDPKMLALNASQGGASMQDRHMRWSDYTELMSRRQDFGTEIYHWYSALRSMWVINPNLNRRVDPDEPETKWKAQLLSDRRFRQALSIAVNRQEIIKAEYSGVGEPSQVAPGPESRFSHERVAKAFTEYDPARANQILDELGLTKRDIEGYRTFPDGSRMVWYLDFTNFTGMGPGQFVVDDWGAVGVRCILRERYRPLFYAEKDGMNFDFNVWTGESDIMPLVYPRYFLPLNSESFYSVGWGKWYMRGGFYDSPQSHGNGSLPIPKDSPMYEAVATYEKALRATNFDEQKRLMDHVMDIAAENTWSISISTPPPQVVVVKKGFKNVPRNALCGVIFWTPSNAGIETYYQEHPLESPGAIAEAKASILHVTPRPGTPSKTVARANWVGTVLRIAVVSIVALLLLMAALRHPFLGRRLLIMVPTLLVVSVAVFVIIRLPPGDYLSTKIIQLEEGGEDPLVPSIKDLKEMYHYDDPQWKQYLRWIGVLWFYTHDASDTGLLQGNMGLSMETHQPVNSMVGDTILLTVVLSLGTILFTWAVALPIGIYSAVKQYSMSDYALTLIGFLGMSAPAFLLALVLTTWAGVSGLFSQQFSAQPEWNWPKFVDLMHHIWIPVVVIGVGGTAGMIRVMRANLLDELKKPYVITAMAKGVRPMKLLMKYPVRMALNPFISGIGALFPQLISGGAIVSIVLSLPTIGPLLLRALLNEDMYLAGSLLMLLSVLGVLGTLISDLLLLWLDPRIRFEGGTR